MLSINMIPLELKESHRESTSDQYLLKCSIITVTKKRAVVNMLNLRKFIFSYGSHTGIFELCTAVQDKRNYK